MSEPKALTSASKREFGHLGFALPLQLAHILAGKMRDRDRPAEGMQLEIERLRRRCDGIENIGIGRVKTLENVAIESERDLLVPAHRHVLKSLL